MPTVVRRHPRRGHFSRLAAGQLFQILIAEPGNGHIFGDQPPRFLLTARLLLEARACAPTAGFAQGGFPDSQHSLGKCLAAPTPAQAEIASAGVLFFARPIIKSLHPATAAPRHLRGQV